MAENITARCAESLKLDSVEDAWVNGMFHNVCGPVNVGILKRELGEKAKMEGGLTFCNMFIKATGKNWVTPAYEFPFNYLEDKTYVEYEPVCSDTNERFIRDYRFDVSKLEPSAAKRKKVEVPTYLTQITHKAWMDTDIASKSPDQVERFVPRYLRKLGVILLPVLVELLAWVSLETLTLTLLHLSGHTSITNRSFSWQDGPQKATDLFTLHSCSISIYTPGDRSVILMAVGSCKQGQEICYHQLGVEWCCLCPSKGGKEIVVSYD
ncbi:uncharacterized protein LOC110103788 isoform X1 [Dendrobium catenatum]|uniref:uncharacterized protein LOC110103788 isoform X1 n=1 Tax=Dendrobium catenatum TaxID=906689 RepID=UPI0009F17D1A|nr:uncharacterized protein LOC110103788 isoform X1 [Dendrobium catenatum]